MKASRAAARQLKTLEGVDERTNELYETIGRLEGKVDRLTELMETLIEAVDKPTADEPVKPKGKAR